jgi:hypothetical protein
MKIKRVSTRIIKIKKLLKRNDIYNIINTIQKYLIIILLLIILHFFEVFRLEYLYKMAKKQFLIFGFFVKNLAFCDVLALDSIVT